MNAFKTLIIQQIVNSFLKEITIEKFKKVLIYLAQKLEEYSESTSNDIDNQLAKRFTDIVYMICKEDTKWNIDKKWVVKAQSVTFQKRQLKHTAKTFKTAQCVAEYVCKNALL